mgnify:CR=1 FL=1
MRVFNWPLIGLFFFFGSVLVLGTFDQLAPTCDAAVLEKASDQLKGVVFSCWEFWLNRYQTTFQTAVSSVIGGAGLLFIVQQLREITRQNDMTRLALDANTQAHAASRLNLTGKAIVAVQMYASGANTLMMEAMKCLSPTLSKAAPIDYPFFARVTASLPDVYPALVNQTLVSEWKTLKAEYDILSIYIMASAVPGVADKAREAVGANAHAAPHDLTDAIVRAAKLGMAMSQFAKKIDI